MSTQYYIDKNEIIAHRFGSGNKTCTMEFQITRAQWDALDDYTIISADNTSYLMYKKDWWNIHKDENYIFYFQEGIRE